MKSQADVRNFFVFCVSIGLALACGGDEGTGTRMPGVSGGTGAFPPPTVGAGTGATPSGGGAAGRGVAGAGTTGVAGRPGGAPVGPVGASGTAAAPPSTAGTAAPSAGGMGAGTAGRGAAGAAPAGGTGAAGTGAPMAGGAAMAGAGGAKTGTGTCCPDGDCICREAPPAMLNGAAKGPYRTESMRASTGTFHYPVDADPPFSAVAICPGFLNSGPEMAPWGPFYASWGIATMVTNTSPADIPDIRALLLMGAVDEMKGFNMAAGNPVNGKLSGRYGTSGYSMGGGGTTISASSNPMALKTSVGLAAWGGSIRGTTVPTLLLCGDSDGVAPCLMSSAVYGAIPESTPKMQITIPGATHFAWFGPGDTTGGISGAKALAFQKVYLDGDTRWKPLLLSMGRGTVETNITP